VIQSNLRYHNLEQDILSHDIYALNINKILHII
jgi:hypothetical protein